MKEHFDPRYLKLFFCIVAAGAVLIVFYEIVGNLSGFSAVLSTINSILAPFIFGLVMAYLLCPVYNLVVRKMYHLLKRKFKSSRKLFSLCRVVATVVSLIVLLGFVGGLAWMVLPGMFKSLMGLVQVMPDRMDDLVAWIEETTGGSKYPHMAQTLENIIDKASGNLEAWIKSELLPRVGDYMTQISQGVIVTLRTLLDFCIGLIVCVYMLNGKEKFRAQTKAIILATMPKKRSDAVFEFAYYTNRTFGGFINGKIIDSIIMGILCFICMSILGMPYAILVSSIVGITNFIPFFGPFIGAIPSAIIICLVSPLQALYFLILILVLQQLDGNIIGPKILGGTTGLASFWVMFAIIVSGGLFGFIGMIVGVPAFAVIYYYIARYIRKRLQKKNMPQAMSEYEDFNKYDINRKDIL